MIVDRVLARRDPGFARRLLAVSRVRLFVFKTQWGETNTEGPLFLYERHAFPFHRLVVLNTKRLKDFVFDFDRNLSYGFQGRLLMLKGDFVYGLWFYSPGECALMLRAMRLPPEAPPKAPGAGEGDRHL